MPNGGDMQTRKESDSLGIVEVPAEALYGAQTQRAVENFPISGKRPYRAFIWSMAAIKGAAAQVNNTLALLDDQPAQAILSAAREVMQGRWDAQFVIDPFQAGAGTSHNMNTNEVLANRATQILGGLPGDYRVHPNDHVNMAQSTNDTIPTAIRLGCLWRLDELIETCHSLVHALEDRADSFDDVVKSGRTHLQDAVPVRLGQEFGAYARAIERDLDRIEQAANGLRRLGIGGTATGTGLNAHPEYHQSMIETLSEWTDLELFSSDNLFESMQSMADMVDFAASLRTLAVTLTRVANDIRLLSSGPSTGLAEIRLPAVQPGSSIMPGKVNPVMAEMLNMAMYHVIGNDTTVMLASQAGQLELNVMMPIIAHNLFEMMQIMIGSVNAFTQKCVVGIEANPDRARELLEKNAIVVTALNPLIGYRVGAELVKKAMAEHRSVREIATERAESGKLKNVDTGEPLAVEDIQEAFDNLHRLTEGGIIA
jgi:fumarate hydratase class II